MRNWFLAFLLVLGLWTAGCSHDLALVATHTCQTAYYAPHTGHPDSYTICHTGGY